jgi:Calcium binding
MIRVMRRGAGKKGPRATKTSKAELDALIEEAIVDAYDESEQIMGFCTMLDEHLDVPFKTEVLGVEVTVEKVDLSDDDLIVAICTRGKSRQRISILALPLPIPPPGRRGMDRCLSTMGVWEIAVAEQMIGTNCGRRFASWGTNTFSPCSTMPSS